MADGDLTARAPVERADEVGRLGESFNQMADRMEGTVVALRRFVGDAAHEIGTPLTALRADLELAEGAASTDDERRLIGRALGQADRLQSLSESLLSLSRIEAGDPNGTVEPVDLAVDRPRGCRGRRVPCRAGRARARHRRRPTAAHGHGRQGPPADRLREPARQRRQVHARRRHRRRQPPAPRTARRSHPSPTPASASPRPSTATCSRASTARATSPPTRAAASASRSCSRPSSATAAPSPSRAPTQALASRYGSLLSSAHESRARRSRLAAGAEEDFELCNDCGGLCCALFLAHDEDGDYIGEGWLPDYIALWEERLVASGALRVTSAAYLPGAAGRRRRCTTHA